MVPGVQTGDLLLCCDESKQMMLRNMDLIMYVLYSDDEVFVMDMVRKVAMEIADKFDFMDLRRLIQHKDQPLLYRCLFFLLVNFHKDFRSWVLSDTSLGLKAICPYKATRFLIALKHHIIPSFLVDERIPLQARVMLLFFMDDAAHAMQGGAGVGQEYQGYLHLLVNVWGEYRGHALEAHQADNSKVAPGSPRRWIDDDKDGLLPLQRGRGHGHELLNVHCTKTLLQGVKGQAGKLRLDEVGSVGHNLLQSLMPCAALPLRHQVQHVLALCRQALVCKDIEQVKGQ